MKYRPEIDGLRALAVVPVILFHAKIPFFGGGFVGVDIFFVISGFLITGILMDDLDAGRFSIVRFYERRARRILPALFFVMLCCLPFAWAWMRPSEMQDFAQSVVAVSVFASNILFFRESSYWAPEVDSKPLLHTWSLSVEEQYYVVFPVLLFFLWKFGPRRAFWTITAIAVASLALSEWSWRHAPVANFFLAPTRAWELLAGSMTAFVVRHRGVRSNEALSLLGLCAILFAIFFYDHSTPFPSLYALVPVLGVVLIIAFSGSSTQTTKLLSRKPLVGIGLISYSAYLWHQPIFAFARIRSEFPPSQLAFLGLSVLSLGLAVLSWRFVEQPFRHRSRFARSHIFALSGAFMSVFIAAGISGHMFNADFERHWLSKRTEQTQATYRLLEGAREAPNSNFGALDFGWQDLSDCRFNFRDLSEDLVERLTDCKARYGSGVLVIGDSHAMDIFGVLVSRFDDPFIVGLTKEGCTADSMDGACQYEDVKRLVEAETDLFRKVIYEQAGYYLFRTADGRQAERADLGQHSETGPDGPTPDSEKIGNILGYLTQLAESTPVVWLLPRTEHHITYNSILKRGCTGDYSYGRAQLERFGSLEDTISKTAKALDAPDLTVMSQNALFQIDLAQDLMNCDAIYWADGDHYSTAGEIRFGARLPDGFLD